MEIAELKDQLSGLRTRVSETSDSLPDETTAQIGIGALFTGAGIILAIANLVQGKKRLGGWVMPATLASSGIALMATGTLEVRAERITSAEKIVMDELDALDPLARAQVLRDVAQEQANRFTPGD